VAMAAGELSLEEFRRSLLAGRVHDISEKAASP